MKMIWNDALVTNEKGTRVLIYSKALLIAWIFHSMEALNRLASITSLISSEIVTEHVATAIFYMNVLHLDFFLVNVNVQNVLIV